MHLGPGFYILRVVDGPLEELPEDGQRVLGPNIRDGIRTLVRGSQDRVRGPRGPFQVADSREGLEGVTEDIEPGIHTSCSVLSRSYNVLQLHRC